VPALPAAAGAPTPTVNTLADVVNPSDGLTSLREAITAANADGNPGALQIGVGGEFLLTLCGGAVQEDNNLDGDLDSLENSDLTFNLFAGPITIRQTCPAERVFHQVGLGVVNVFDTTFTGGSTTSSGAGISSLGSLHLTRSSVVDNHSIGGTGGGISAFSLTMTDSEVRGNSASVAGGVSAGISLSMTRSSVSENVASQGPGGVLSDSGVSLTSSTVADNLAIFDDVGGIETPGTVSLSHATVAGNQTLEGVAPAIDSSQLSANRSVIADNTGADGVVIPQCDVSGTPSSGGFNVTSDTSCELNGGTDLDGVGDADVRHVFRNGGPTETVWLEEDSEAVDLIPAGQCSQAQDQRGAVRPSGGACDAGAVEVQACGGLFGDVSASHSFCDEIGWMSEAGITTGFPGGLYKPSGNVTRQSMSAFMFRLAGSPPFVDPVAPSFSDVSAGNPFFTEIEWMNEEGITTGFPGGLFKPAANVTRQSMSAFMFRLADGLVD
jgi:CSLREA domain-containing protein